jgi:post-GPI attachment to proteins factor 3
MLSMGALTLQVLDFPPVFGLLDAHAIWHVLTIPLVYKWYQFVRGDAVWMGDRQFADIEHRK